MERDLTVWIDTRSRIRRKVGCIKNYNKRNHYAGVRFIDDVGDLPVYVFREDSKLKPYAIVNNRGWAYSCRNRLQHKNKPQKFKGFMTY